MERKLQEQYLAVELEKNMSKEEILESYLNMINLGQNALGIQAAANRYFNKDVRFFKSCWVMVLAPSVLLKPLATPLTPARIIPFKSIPLCF